MDDMWLRLRWAKSGRLPNGCPDDSRLIRQCIRMLGVPSPLQLRR